jgi:hypothetical protein
MAYIGGRWKDYEGMLLEWCGSRWDYSDKPSDPKKELEKPIPNKSEVLFASYGGGSYEGDAVVIFRKGEKLYEVNGSHCSCYGLEGQWKPEETSLEALARKGKKTDGDYGYHFLYDHDDPAYDEYWKLVSKLQKKK